MLISHSFLYRFRPNAVCWSGVLRPRFSTILPRRGRLEMTKVFHPIRPGLPKSSVSQAFLAVRILRVHHAQTANPMAYSTAIHWLTWMADSARLPLRANENLFVD